MKCPKKCKKLTIWRGHSARLWRASRAQYLIPRVYAIPIPRGRVTHDKKQLRRSCYHGARAWIWSALSLHQSRAAWLPGPADWCQVPEATKEPKAIRRFRLGHFGSARFVLGSFPFRIGKTPRPGDPVRPGIVPDLLRPLPAVSLQQARRRPACALP